MFIYFLQLFGFALEYYCSECVCFISISSIIDLISCYFLLVILVWSVRSTTVKDIGYYCQSSQIEDLVHDLFHLHQLTEESVIAIASLTGNCCNFLSEWFKFQSVKFLLIVSIFYFKHPFTLVFTALYCKFRNITLE